VFALAGDAGYFQAVTGSFQAKTNTNRHNYLSLASAKYPKRNVALAMTHRERRENLRTICVASIRLPDKGI
jgi:hypothetical protein